MNRGSETSLVYLVASKCGLVGLIHWGIKVSLRPGSGISQLTDLDLPPAVCGARGSGPQRCYADNGGSCAIQEPWVLANHRDWEKNGKIDRAHIAIGAIVFCIVIAVGIVAIKYYQARHKRQRLQRQYPMRTPEQRRQERPSAATSSISWKQWTPAEVANFVRGLTSDFGEKANVYAETLFKEDIDSDVLANFSPGNLKELGLSLGHGFKLLHRFKEAQPPGTFPDPPGRHWTLREPSQTLRDAETEELTHVDSGSARRVPVPEDAGRPPLPFVGASMLTAAAGDGKGQYIHTSPATVHMPVPEESQLPATSLAAAVTAAHQNGSRNANCNPPPDWSSGLGSRGLFNWTRQDIELARKSPATPLHTRGDGSQNSAAQTQRAQLTKEDLKKVQDVNTLPAFDPDATAGLGQHPSFFNALATTRSRIFFSLLLHFFFNAIRSCCRTALIGKNL